VEAAVAGLPVSTNAFYKNLPEAMVQTRYALEWIETGVTARTNLVVQSVPLINPGRERGVLVETPFPIFGQDAVGVWNGGKVSVGGQHGDGAHQPGDTWRHEFWVLQGGWETRPDLSTNSCVRFGTTYTNGQAATFWVRWSDVRHVQSPSVRASFEIEFFRDGAVVYRYFEGCNPALLPPCETGVAMAGVAWSTPLAVGEGREIRLHRLGTLQEEKAFYPGLMLTHFDAWYHRVDTTLEYEIFPGLLLSLGLCPNHPETWWSILPAGLAYVLAMNDVTFADLLMVHMINPFEWNLNPADLQTNASPSHPLLTPAYGGKPFTFTLDKPLAPGTMGLLVVGNLRLPLSNTSPQTFTLYLAEGQEVAFQTRGFGEPDISPNEKTSNATNVKSTFCENSVSAIPTEHTRKPAIIE
jgi:hypothetical protein